MVGVAPSTSMYQNMGLIGGDPTRKKDPTTAAYDAYDTAAKTQGADYSDIMGKYRDIYSQAGMPGSAAGLNFNFNYNKPTYTNSQDYKDSVKRLSGLADTGGYSPEDIANIRERAISPIRSVYGNAKMNLDRTRSLQGGYSPNYSAVTAKMAREMGSSLSDATTNANAQIAQNIASNKLQVAPQLAGLTADEQNQHNQFNLNAAEMDNKYGLANVDNQIQQYTLPLQMKLSALNGMTGLYGTTPADTALMQKGALSQAELQNNINQQKLNNGVRTVDYYMGGRR